MNPDQSGSRWQTPRAGNSRARRYALTPCRGALVFPIILALSVAATPAAAQTGNVVGIVRDSISNEPIVSARVSVVGLERQTLTDAYGRFSFVNLQRSGISLVVDRLGYRTAIITIDSATAQAAMTIVLAPDAIMIDGVSVSAERRVLETSREASVVTVSPRELAKLPTLADADIFRSLQLLPGVGGTNDASSGLYVRGGTPDENLVLLDGMTVYHVDHFFGVFSAFNAEAIKDVRFHKSAYPARYGGRVSSVVDMTGKSGDNQVFRASGTLNLLSGGGVAEVPLGGRGALIVSARRSYTDILKTPLYDKLFGTLQGGVEEAPAPLPGGRGAGPGGGGLGGGGRGGFGGNVAQQSFTPTFYFWDFNSKLTYSATGQDVVALSVYGGQDNLDQSVAGTTVTINGQDGQTPNRTDLTDWGNSGASGVWTRQWSPRLTSNLLLAGSEYFSNSDQTIERNGLSNGLVERNRVRDYSIRADLAWKPLATSVVDLGAEVSRFDASYDFTQAVGDSTAGGIEVGQQSTLASVYTQHVWTPSQRFQLTLGARAISYQGTDSEYFEPRASSVLRLSDQLSLKAAWGRYHQVVKRVENEDILEGSRDFWILADESLPVLSAEHRVIGATFETAGILLDVEAYDKQLEGVSLFSTRSRRTPNQDFRQLFFSGHGRARGLEVLAQKKFGQLNGWLGYTLGSVSYDLDGFNGDAPFPASQDQRHELKAVATLGLGPWTLGGTWVFGSGKPFTLPESQYDLRLLDGSLTSYIHVGAKNGERLSAYHRLDLSAGRRFETRRMYYEINASLFNVYNHNNVWYRQFDLSSSPVVITDVKTLGFTPSLGVRVGLR